jgi:Tol biopolymer transport system component
MNTRAEVYQAIDSERDYQDSLWNPETTPTQGIHSPAEWVLYISDYVREATTQASRSADPQSREAVLNTIRKIAGMAVACMEQNGAPQRIAPAKDAL